VFLTSTVKMQNSLPFYHPEKRSVKEILDCIWSQKNFLNFCIWYAWNSHNCTLQNQGGVRLGFQKKCYIFVVNISQIKHTRFSFDFLFATNLSNYNAVVFTGKRHARMEGVQAFILSMKRESLNKAYTETPTKNIGNLPRTIKRFTLYLSQWTDSYFWFF